MNIMVYVTDVFLCYDGYERTFLQNHDSITCNGNCVVVVTFLLYVKKGDVNWRDDLSFDFF